jgi:ATP-binding cassette subfamily C protein CydD
MAIEQETGWRGAGDRTAVMLAVIANALWIPQAWCLAAALAGIVLGAGWVAALGGFAGLGLLRAGLEAAAHARAASAASRFKAALRARVAREVAAWSPIDIRRPPPGEIATLTAEGIESLEPYLVRHGPARARTMVVPVLILVAVAAIHWMPALLLLFAGPLVPVFMALIGANAREASDRQLAEVGGLSGALLDRLNGLETILLHDAVEPTAERLRLRAEAIRLRTMAVLRVAFLSSAVLELVAMVGVGAVAVFVGFTFLGWIALAPGLSLAGGLFVLLLAPEFFQPLRDFGAAYHDKAAADAVFGRLETLFPADRSRLLGRGEAVEETEGGPVGVALEGVTFRYPGAGIAVLDGFDLTVKPGERVAIVGPSGAGKSTVLALIGGLAEADVGRVLVEGEAMTDATADRLRAGIAVLPQAAALFHGSVLANVTLGRAASRAETDAALAVAQAGFVARLPRGDLTRLGEDGVGLSGGEARRIGLARAALGDTRLVLADEPTAYLDAANAAAVTEALIALAAGRTLIVATHDPALAARMDRVVTLPGAGDA